MLQALFQTIANFFIDIPSVKDLFDKVSGGETKLFSGFVSMIAGLFKKD